MSRLSMIVLVNVVLNRTVVVDSDWCFNNLCGSQPSSESKWVVSLSTTTVQFKIDDVDPDNHNRPPCEMTAGFKPFTKATFFFGFDLLTNSLNHFLKLMYGDQSGKLLQCMWILGLERLLVCYSAIPALSWVRAPQTACHKYHNRHHLEKENGWLEKSHAV